MSDVLVQYLREARATEAGLAQTLQAHIAVTPPGEHRGQVEKYLQTTRSHERLLAARIGELDRGDPLRQALDLAAMPIGFGLGVARALLDIVVSPLASLRAPEPTTADLVMRSVRSEAAGSAAEIVNYTAIERLAEAEGDEQTAGLAGELRADEEELLAYLREAAVELGDRVAGRSPERTADSPQRTGGPQGGNGSAPPAADTRPPTPEPLDLTPEPPEPMHVSEEPELVAEFADPGAEDEAGPEIEVEPPWEDYDRMTAQEIIQRLEGASDELVAVVELYESANKTRQSVLRAAETRLRTG